MLNVQPVKMNILFRSIQLYINMLGEYDISSAILVQFMLIVNSIICI